MKEGFKQFGLSLTGGLLGVLLGIVFGCTLMYFCIDRHSVYAQRPNVGNVDAALLDAQSSAQGKDGAKVGVDFYLCEITDFYESLITILFSAIGIILFVGFLYVYNASRKRADDMARKALDDESFGIKLKKQIEDIVSESTKTAIAKLSSDNNIPEIAEIAEYLNIDILEDMRKRIKFSEKEITKLSYSATKDVISEKPQEEKP